MKTKICKRCGKEVDVEGTHTCCPRNPNEQLINDMADCLEEYKTAAYVPTSHVVARELIKRAREVVK